MHFLDRKAAIPDGIKSILGGESPSDRKNVSPIEAEWAYQTLNRLVRPTDRLPPVDLTVIGALALKMYCEWKTGEDKRRGKPVKRETKDLDSAAVLSQNRIRLLESEARRNKFGFDYSYSKDRVAISNFNAIGMDINTGGLVGKCIPTAEVCHTANVFTLGNTEIRAINEPFFVISKLAAMRDRGKREDGRKDAIDIATMVYVRYGSMKAFLEDERASATITNAIEEGYTAYFDVYSKRDLCNQIRGAIEESACSDAPQSVLRGISKDSDISETARKAARDTARGRGIAFAAAKRRV